MEYYYAILSRKKIVE